MNKYIEFFNNYTDHYIQITKNDFQKIHINRKIEHSKRVNKLSIEIAKKLNLNEKELFLINIASLLHDIGRFKQFYEYSTYIDKISCNHATLGVEILEKEKILNDLEKKDKETILQIIKLHNYKVLPQNKRDKLYLYASIIRDADKIDWIYSMVNIIPNLSKENQAVFYSNKLDKHYISQDIVNSVLNNEPIIRDNLTTIDELRVSAMAWTITDIKNKPSLEIIKQEDLINKTFKLIYDSKEKNIIFEHIKKYFENKFI